MRAFICRVSVFIRGNFGHRDPDTQGERAMCVNRGRDWRDTTADKEHQELLAAEKLEEAKRFFP